MATERRRASPLLEWHEADTDFVWLVWLVWLSQPWSERRWRILAALHFHRLAVVAFQEALHSQVLDLQAMLGPTWEHVGVGRDDGREAGEYSPLFYQTTRFERISWETVWLSPEPSKPGSVGWDAVSMLSLSVALAPSCSADPSTFLSLRLGLRLFSR